MAKTFVWKNDEDDLWYVGAETARGNSWASDYWHLAGGFTSREEALTEARFWKYEYNSNSFVRNNYE